ncbi:MAG: hypothetical protein ACTSV7_09215 [Candidatus Baldrarchaeia archaeon]
MGWKEAFKIIATATLSLTAGMIIGTNLQLILFFGGIAVITTMFLWAESKFKPLGWIIRKLRERKKKKQEQETETFKTNEDNNI